jgi:hypothetical protein
MDGYRGDTKVEGMRKWRWLHHILALFGKWWDDGGILKQGRLGGVDKDLSDDDDGDGEGGGDGDGDGTVAAV